MQGRISKINCTATKIDDVLFFNTTKTLFYPGKTQSSKNVLQFGPDVKHDGFN